jgi:ribosome-interacting GTPase 1
MPANLSPEYKAAEANFRKAREPTERLEWLREMLRTIPKHKGTDHLQGDIKTRIKELSEALAGPKKGAARGGPATVIRPEGAAQIALIGPPNSGKSALHARLTGSHAETGPYPFTTQFPQPGMLPFADIHFQLVDLPPLTREHPVPWLGNALEPADGCLLVVDLGDPACLDALQAVLEVLAQRRITLTECWPADRAPPAGVQEESLGDDPFARRLPALLIVNKADRIPNLSEELRVFRELSGVGLPELAVSAETGIGLGELGPYLFHHLGVVRVYTKAPGRPPDMDKPFTLRRGETVLDLASLVHRDLAQSLKYARVWGGSHFNGQQVGRDHPLEDGDVLELHA